MIIFKQMYKFVSSATYLVPFNARPSNFHLIHGQK